MESHEEIRQVGYMVGKLPYLFFHHAVPERNKKPIYEGYMEKGWPKKWPDYADPAVVLRKNCAVLDIDTPTGHKEWRDETDTEPAQHQLIEFAESLFRKLPIMERSLFHATFTASGKGLHLFMHRKWPNPDMRFVQGHKPETNLRPRKYMYKEGELFDGTGKVSLYNLEKLVWKDVPDYFWRCNHPPKARKTRMLNLYDRIKWKENMGMTDSDIMQLGKLLTPKLSDSDELVWRFVRLFNSGDRTAIENLIAESITKGFNQRRITNIVREADEITDRNPTINKLNMKKRIK